MYNDDKHESVKTCDKQTEGCETETNGAGKEALGTSVNKLEREVSPGAGDSWMTVDASSLIGTGEKKEERQPELFTLLSQNGLTQELASVLSSIDDTTATKG